MTVSVFELIDRALDHLYTVNNVLPDTVDDEVTQELGNAIEVCVYAPAFKMMPANVPFAACIASTNLPSWLDCIHDIEIPISNF